MKDRIQRLRTIYEGIIYDPVDEKATLVGDDPFTGQGLGSVSV